MKKFLAIGLTLALGGCAGLQRLETAYTFVTETTVPVQTIVVAANTFNGIEGTATQYLVYCKPKLSEPICSKANRQTVIRAVRFGRAARNQLETYMVQGTPAPSAIYNTMVAAITTLQASAATQVGGLK